MSVEPQPADLLPREREHLEFLACKEDFDYFRRRYLKVRDRDEPDLLVRFQLRYGQQQVLETLRMHGSTYFLKYRRFGCSRAIMSEWLASAHFGQHPVISVFHNEKDGKEAFQQVRQWYAALPGFLKEGPYALAVNREDYLEWKHGGAYRVSWDQAQPAGSHTWVMRHYSEVGKFKDDNTIRVIEGGVSKYGRQVFETTADGLGLAWTLWETDNGLHKVFLDWRDDAGYSMSESELVRAGFRPKDVLTPVVKRYAEEHGLTREQMLWMGVKLRQMAKDRQDALGLMRGFHSEFPATPALAFQSASGRVFPTLHYAVDKPRVGLKIYAKAEPYRVFAIGVDIAAGVPDGDYSAAVVVDWTNRDKPTIAAVLYERMSPGGFADAVMELARSYNNALLVPERNSIGITFITLLQERGADNFYVETVVGRVSTGPTERLGFQSGDYSKQTKTALLKRWLEEEGLVVPDHRLRYEINNVTYNEREQMEARKPFHDDALDALGCALIGGEQISVETQAMMVKRPSTNAEWLAYRTACEDNPAIEGNFEPSWIDEVFGVDESGMVTQSTHDFIGRKRA